MEDKKKSILLAGCSLFVILTIALVMNFHFTKINNYNDTKNLGDESTTGSNSSGTKTTTRVCTSAAATQRPYTYTSFVTGCSSNAASCVKVASAGGPCGTSSACYSQTVVITQTVYTCPSGFTQYGGQCCKDVEVEIPTQTCYLQGNSTSSCSSITIDTSNGKSCTDNGYYSNQTECESNLVRVECFSVDSSCKAMTYASDKCPVTSYASQQECENARNNTIICYSKTVIQAESNVERCFESKFNGTECPEGYYTSKEACGILDESDYPCKIESVTTESKITSIHNDGLNENSYYVGTIKTSGNCAGVTIPCDTDNGKANITKGQLNGNETSHVDIIGKPGQNTYECYIYPEKVCDSSTVSSQLGNQSTDTISSIDSNDSATVSKIKYDWHDVSTCVKNPEYTSALDADKNNADTYWSDYGLCDDGVTMGYTKRWIRNVYCETPDSPSSPPSSTPVNACYADSPDLRNAKTVKWTTLSDAQKNGLSYPIRYGIDGKEITEKNQLEKCKKPDVVTENKYCYANNANIDDATEVAMLTVTAYNEKMKDSSFKLRYQIKDSSGNPLDDASSCIASACYVENGTVNYTWAPNGSLDANKYSKVAIYTKSECKNAEACLAKPGKDGYEEVQWFNTQSTIDKKISEGWVNLSVTDKNLCKKGHCYKINGSTTEYTWIETGQAVPSGYTQVEDSYCETTPPATYELPACYIKTLDDGTIDYKWGSKLNGYTKIDIKEEYCINSKNCYLRLSDGTYHNGDYSLNDEYMMVDDANCRTVPAPRTDFDRSAVMYIAMLFLAAAGVGLTYYGNLKRKHS